MTKDQWRKTMRALLAKVPAQSKKDQGVKALALISKWVVFQKAQVIGCYSSIESEIDTLPLLLEILSQGKTLALPKVIRKGEMRFYQVQDLAQRNISPYGILEPRGNEREIFPQEMDLCFVPALAVNPKGGRLGHGGGFYDRFLPNIKGESGALVLKEQLVEGFPCEKYDFLVKYIIDSDGIQKINTV